MRGSNGWYLARRHEEEAAAFAFALRPLLLKLAAEGNGRPTDIARRLNASGIEPRGGGKWHSTSVIRVLRRLGKAFSDEVREARLAELSRALRHLT